MAINVNETTKAAVGEIKILAGSEINVSIPNGKTFVIETTPGGTEFLSIAPATGKRWINGRIEIYFEEVDI